MPPAAAGSARANHPAASRAAVPPAPGSALAVAAVLGSLAGWTSIPLFLKHFTTSIDAWTGNGWRYGFSALLWAPVLVLGARRGTLPPGLWKAALIPSAFNVVAQICFALAPYYINPGLMTFSLRVQIVFVTIGAALMFASERRVMRNPLFLAGLLMVVGGTVATILLNPSGLGDANAMGVGLAIASGILYGAYALSVRRCMSGIPTLVAFAAVCQYTAAALIGLMLVYGTRMGAPAIELPPAQFAYLLLSSLVGIGLGHSFYYYSISRLGVAVSAGVVQLQPVTVSIGSYFLFQEVLTRLQWGTGLLAIVGAVLILVAQHRVKRAEAPATRVDPLDEFDDLPVDPDVAIADQSNESSMPAPGRSKSRPSPP